jgi:hypothetical protein
LRVAGIDVIHDPFDQRSSRTFGVTSRGSVALSHAGSRSYIALMRRTSSLASFWPFEKIRPTWPGRKRHRQRM